MKPTINIKTNVKAVTKGLNRKAKKQLPFATSIALNETGALILKGLQREADNTFDGGATPSTLRAFKPPKGLKGRRPNIIFSTKKNLKTKIFIPDWAAEYLQYQIEGGIRRTSGKGTGVPTRNRKLNVYGNIPGRKSGLVKGSKQFMASIRGIDGVWEKTSNGSKLLIAFEKNPKYRKKFKYYETGQKLYKTHFKRKLKLAINKAMRSAR